MLPHRYCCKTLVTQRIRIRRRTSFPARFFVSSGPALTGNNQRGRQKENRMNTLIQFKKITPVCLIVCMLGCLAPQAQAVVPPPDGDYPGQNTAEGTQALLSLTTGLWNT